MWTYALVLMLLAGNDNTTTTVATVPGYTTRAACEEAGQAFVLTPLQTAPSTKLQPGQPKRMYLCITGPGKP